MSKIKKYKKHLCARDIKIMYICTGGVLFCGSRKLTYFHGGKRKYRVISTDFGHKNSDGNGNNIMF